MKRRLGEVIKNRLKLTDISSFLQLPWNTWLFGSLPPLLSKFYLRTLAALYFQLASKERSAIKRSLEATLGASPTPRQDRRRWARARAGIIDHYHEKLYLAFKSYSTIRQNCLDRVKIRNQELLDQALAQGRGVILITGHYGALEFMPGALAFREYPLSVMVHCKTPRLKVILEERAAGAGTELMDPKSGEVLFTALEHLKRGRILITQCDEISMWRPYKDKTVRFLGLEVPLDRSMDLLARKSKAVVLMGLVHRLGGRRYELELLDPAKHPAAQGQQNVSVRCLSVLTEYIFQRPDHWYEWKKLNQFLPAPQEMAHADKTIKHVLDPLAFQPGGVPQPG
ncbi:MAG: lysophospholipid acyltransferase family protein [Proteobacteria bacterium]|nr:lysophospholipid acyltransferase family protein [Pseudomonadota bacterium]MBU1449485.1 lysophospholipid acyltransferase family protein [Pseudomonadota bacterium]MBU2468765.1 lysophospholipid acyltransferase family protein [Pseudomonadota bacterium]MBU2518856.1 lysophospholipid acyltransferase family protein [Pseudomonadota bacterium]